MSKEKILIAEDDEDVRNICVRVLSEENYQVTAVENGLLAIEVAKQDSFDMLLTDIKMPQLDGLETARTIKTLYPDIVCVIMTGFGTMDTAIRALQLGADEFLVKPFTPDVLSAAVAKAMEKVRLQRENIRLRALIPLFELSRTLMSTVAEDELLPRVLEVAQQETRADKAALLLLDQDGQQLAARAERNLDVQTALGPELAVKIAQTSQQLALPGRSETTTLAPSWAAQLIQADIHTAIITPLISKTKPLGALIVAKTFPQDQFAPSDAEMLSILCGQAAIAIQNAHLFKEIQQTYEELKELDRLKSEFINIAAHELRTPLAILIGHASLLAEELDGPAGERLQIIMRNAMRLRTLIKDILTLRHLESGGQTTEGQYHRGGKTATHRGGPPAAEPCPQQLVIQRRQVHA
jgi:CheY-like chemotaxis protein/GAF domain-containing protein